MACVMRIYVQLTRANTMEYKVSFGTLLASLSHYKCIYFRGENQCSFGVLKQSNPNESPVLIIIKLDHNVYDN